MSKIHSTKDGGVHVVLRNAHVTEKTAMMSGEANKRNVYVFNVDPRSTKCEVERAIKDIYKVSPARINILVRKGKRKFARGKIVTSNEAKIAYVFLKKGDK